MMAVIIRASITDIQQFKRERAEK